METWWNLVYLWIVLLVFHMLLGVCIFVLHLDLPSFLSFLDVHNSISLPSIHGTCFNSTSTNRTWTIKCCPVFPSHCPSWFSLETTCGHLPTLASGCVLEFQFMWSKQCLVGGFTPLKNICLSVGMIILNTWENNPVMFQENHQPDVINDPCGNGLYHLFMMLTGRWCYGFLHPQSTGYIQCHSHFKTHHPSFYQHLLSSISYIFQKTKLLMMKTSSKKSLMPWCFLNLPKLPNRTRNIGRTENRPRRRRAPTRRSTRACSSSHASLRTSPSCPDGGTPPA